MSEETKTSRIFVPLIRDYYIFEYVYTLAAAAVERGFEVTFFGDDPVITKKVSHLCPGARVLPLPKIIRFFLNRSDKVLFRICLILSARLWGHIHIARHYDFGIIPWTTRPLWNVLSHVLPALTVNNVTNMSTVEDSLGELTYDSSQQPPTFGQKLGFQLDRFGLMSLRRAEGRIVQFNGLDIIDRLLGVTWTYRENGFNGIKHLTVMGNAYVENYVKLGLDTSRTNIHVIGSPSYEGLIALKERFSETDRHNFMKEHNLPIGSNTYSLFLSPSRFNEQQIYEIEEVVAQIQKTDQTSFFVIKFHPKTGEAHIEALKDRLLSFADRIQYVTEFTGDEENAKLILCSKAIVQKQGTVGLLAAMLHVPIVSYDIRETNYHDDMYELLDISDHCKTVDELGKAVSKLLQPEYSDIRIKRLEYASDRYCQPHSSPCNAVLDIIEAELTQCRQME